MKSYIKSKVSSFTKKHVLPRNPYTFNYQIDKKREWQGEIETYFQSEDGRQIPVYKNHRYGLKKCWGVFGPISALKELKQRGLLSGLSVKFLNDCIGNRTIMMPFGDIREHLDPYLNKHRDLFISEKIPDIGQRLMIPSAKTTEELVSKRTVEHKTLIENINRYTKKGIKPGDNVLEIGYTSGGESIIAFEQCGLNALGIDNYYHNTVEATNRHDIVVKQIANNATFLRGDITRETELESNSLDFIYSQSVIEHITALPEAFKEMYRLLKPGGVMFHRYDPYFHIVGGHSHGTLDSPWAHVRLSENDMIKYIKELRPNEAPITLPWIKSALNRNHSQANILKLLSNAGFRISFWQNTAIKRDYQPLLTEEIIQDCISINSDKALTISDLNSAAVSILVEKPE